MEDCLFCRIAAGLIPSKKVYEDEDTFAFRDIAPQAKTHVLVIPKKHIPDWLAGGREGDRLAGSLMRAVCRVAEAEGLEAGGFRVISNTGSDACQSVRHLHLHVLGGEKLSERMG